MMVFMVCFFGFMDYMILYKWVTPLENPPSIINSLIAMGMWQDDPNPMFSMGVVRLLMTLSMLTVPVMLIPKPILLALQNAAKHRNRRSTSSRQLRASDEETFSLCANGEANIKEHEEEEEFEIGEVVIHQVIETIEYVLGTVSHTASYLRLWALSLAHQQLSLVFFQKTILGAMTVSLPWNVIAIFLAFAVWLSITLAILCGMDVLECFLHTLRLHWVEFQSKFYKADGYAFIPYRHSTILEEEE
jgi:V-type H+-transporting ATPase subunit a